MTLPLDDWALHQAARTIAEYGPEHLDPRVDPRIAELVAHYRSVGDREPDLSPMAGTPTQS